MERFIIPGLVIATSWLMASPARCDESAPSAAARLRQERVETVVRIPGLVAFWDFVAREGDGQRRFIAHVPAGADNAYPLDAGNYVHDYWGAGRDATYEDFPLLGRGPFGEAILIRKEADRDFRPFLFVPRSRLHDTPLDIKGPQASVTVVVWATWESGNHGLAGIWHEGTDLKMDATVGIKRVERGQRQYALFAGLSKPGTACGHISENGAASFTGPYALHKCNSGDAATAVAIDADPATLDRSWHTFATTFDRERCEMRGWLDGKSTERWFRDPAHSLALPTKAWLQGRLRKIPGQQPGEDPSFPEDQFYNPPEDVPVSVKTVSETAVERVQVREYPYTRVQVTDVKGPDGQWTESDRQLEAIKVNPWWYPHGIYEPKPDGSGGPFTIGRVIHSARSTGFSGWIGGVAVYDRPLDAAEMAALARCAAPPPVPHP
jgi:hypothetical protein